VSSTAQIALFNHGRAEEEACSCRLDRESELVERGGQPERRCGDDCEFVVAAVRTLAAPRQPRLIVPHDSQVVWKIRAVMSSPMMGSAMGTPRAMNAVETTMPALT